MLGVDCEAIEAAYQTLWLGGEFALLRCLTYTACLTVATRNPLCHMLSLHGGLEGHPFYRGVAAFFCSLFLSQLVAVPLSLRKAPQQCLPSAPPLLI